MLSLSQALPRIMMMPRRQHGRMRDMIATVAVATAVVAGAALIPSNFGSAPVSPSGADVWVNPSTGNNTTCERGDQSFPCLTLARAVTIAQSGDEIELQQGSSGGWYPCERISNNTKVLTIAAADGATVWFACTSTLDPVAYGGSGGFSLQLVDSSNITLENIKVAGFEWARGSNVTLNNVDITCNDESTHFELWGGLCNAALQIFANAPNRATNFTMNGGSIGPSIDNEAGSYPGSSRIDVDNSHFDGVTFHDNRREPGGHSECLMIEGGNVHLIENSKFLRCATYTVFITCFPCASGGGSSQAPTDITFENDFLGPGDQTFMSLEIRSTNPPTEVNFRYNTIYKYLAIGNGFGEVTGNILAYGESCVGSYTYKYNVYGDDIGRSRGDSTNTSHSSTAFTSDGTGYNTTTGVLGATSPAVGHGDPSDHPATDYEGDTRPTGVVDSGWDER